MAVSTILFAQGKKVVADKIIATIGDKIILKSDIDNSIHDMERQNMEVPPNADCLLLEQAMGLKALVVQAERDSIPVDETDVEATMDNRIRYMISQYGSKEILEQGVLKPSDIYLNFGYNNLSNFSIAFKNKFGITPKEA